MPRTRKTPRERELAREIKGLDRIAAEAQGKGSYQAAVAAKGKASQLRNELDRLAAEREAEAITDPLARVQRLRRRAAESGSWVAAARLATLEANLANGPGKATDDLDDLTDEEILREILSAVAALPEPIVARIAEACEERLGPKANPQGTPSLRVI